MDKWIFYKDAEKQWRWQRFSRNHRIVGAASQGYRLRRSCLANARRNGYKT